MISQWPTEQVLPMQLGHHVVPQLYSINFIRYII